MSKGEGICVPQWCPAYGASSESSTGLQCHRNTVLKFILRSWHKILVRYHAGHHSDKWSYRLQIKYIQIKRMQSRVLYPFLKKGTINWSKFNCLCFKMEYWLYHGEFWRDCCTVLLVTAPNSFNRLLQHKSWVPCSVLRPVEEYDRQY